MRAFFSPSEKVECGAEDIMSIPLDRLCQLSWPLLRERQGAHNLTGMRFPMPMRINASPKATEQAFGASIHETVAGIMKELDSQVFADEPLTCFRMRSVLFQHVLGRLRCEAPAAVREARPVMTAAGTAVRLKAAGATGVPVSCAGAAASTPPEETTSSPSSRPPRQVGRSRAQPQRQPPVLAAGGPIHPPGKDDEENLSSDARRGCTFDPARKPNPFVYFADDDSVTREWLETRAAEVVQAARTGPQNDAQGNLVRTAVHLGLRAGRDPRAGRAFAILLQAVLAAAGASEAQPQEEKAAEARIAHHRIFVFRVVVPMLHLIPLLEWREDVLEDLGSLLTAAPDPQACGYSLGGELETTASFMTHTFISLSEVAQQQSIAPAHTTSPAMNAREELARQAVAEEEAETESREGTPSSASPVGTDYLHEIPELIESEEDEPHATENEGETDVTLWDTADRRTAPSQPSLDDASTVQSFGSSAPALAPLSSWSSATGPQHPSSAFSATGCVSRSRTSAFPALTARRVVVVIHRASHCEDVRLMIFPRRTPIAPGEDVAVICQTPRTGAGLEFDGPCEVRVLCMNDEASTHCPVLHAEIRAELAFPLDSRWELEWSLALVHAQQFVAHHLLRSMQRATTDGALELPSALFRNGLRSVSRAEEAGRDAFAVSIAEMPQHELQQRARCRLSDIHGVRAVLMVVGNALRWLQHLPGGGEEVYWRSRVWVDVLRHVNLHSSVIGRCAHAEEIANFVVNHVQCVATATPMQIVEAAVQLFSNPHASANEIQKVLQERRRQARLTALVLALLLKASARVTPNHLAHVAKTTKTLLTPREHYLSPLMGCGDALEDEVRQALYVLLKRLFTALRGVVARATRAQSSPHKFLLEPWAFGAFMLLTISLLASNLDKHDINYIRTHIISEVIGLLPNFTSLTRTSSFLVNEDAESSFMAVFASILCDSAGGEGTLAECCVASDEIKVVSMTGVRQEPRGLFTSQSSIPFAQSEEPVYCCSHHIRSVVKHIQVQLLNNNLTGFYIGLSASAFSYAAPDVQADPKGYYFFADGTFKHNLQQSVLPPWRAGDVVDITFAFAMTHWRMEVLLNGSCLVSLAAPENNLFLVIGTMDNTNHGVSYRGSFESPSSSSDRELPKPTHHGTAPAELTAARPLGRPTFYNISLFTALTLHYLILCCAKKQRPAQRQGLASGFVSPAISGAAASRTPMTHDSEDAMRNFVDYCCVPLRRNLEVLVRSVEALPATASGADSTERVKQRTALLVYNNLMMDYTITLAVTLRCASSPVDIMNTLTEVVCCQRVLEKTRSVALSAAYNAMNMPFGGFGLFAFNPARLWQCCRELAVNTTARGYCPVFSSNSVADGMVVLAGGRQVRPCSVGAQRIGLHMTSYASRGIALDGSMGDVVSFSVRLQRGFPTDNLGRFYHVGVACLSAFGINREVNAHPGERTRQHTVYSLTDFYSDVADPKAKAELARHRANWLSGGDDATVFGSGDVITVHIHVKLRCISFERNAKPLGVLFRQLPLSVKVLVPLVELYNRDSSAKWMYPPSEIAMHARYTMRALLRRWATELMPSLEAMLDEAATTGDCTGLNVLGADGDELSKVYRAPPRSDVVTRIQEVRVVRIEHSFAVVEDANGVTLKVCTAALEANNASSSVSCGPAVASCIERILLLLLQLTAPLSESPSEQTAVTLKRPDAILRTLRILAEVDQEARLDLPGMRELLSSVVQRLLMILAADSVNLPAEIILREAWNEIAWAVPPPPLQIDVRPPSALGDHLRCAAEAPDNVRQVAPASDEEGATAAVPQVQPCLHFRCPTCDSLWDECQAHHPAPSNLCVLCHLILQQRQQPSPYTGWIATWQEGEEASASAAHQDNDDDEDDGTNESNDGGTWEDFEEDSDENDTTGEDATVAFRLLTHITFRRSEDDPDVLEGSGEMQQGPFTFSGRLSADVFFGYIKFTQAQSTSPPESSVPEVEWGCTMCTFVNLPDSTRCAMCGSARPGAVWVCLTCNYGFNAKTSNVCATCGNMRFGAGHRGMARELERICYCDECHQKFEYVSFATLRSRRYCDRCARVTLWLPNKEYTGAMKARLVGEGDSLEFSWCIENHHCTVYGLHTTSYTAGQLKQLVQDSSMGCTSDRDLAHYAPPLGQLSLLKTSSTPPRDTGNMEACTMSAIIYYASRLVLQWTPLVSAKVFSDPAVLTRLRVFDEKWLDWLQDIPLADAVSVVHTCLDVLRKRTDSPHVVRSVSSIARVLLRTHYPLHPQRHYLLYFLCMNISQCTTRRTREVSYECMTDIFEDYPEAFINTQCMSPALRMRPIVAGQERAALYALLHGVSAGCTNANTKAAACLVKSLSYMEHQQPVPRLLECDITLSFPYVVTLAETSLSDGGALLIGQARGSVGATPAQKGKYYYEVVLPPNFGESGNMVMMGWGTLQHEHLNSGQHVGSDLHSWGFNCRDRLRLMLEDQLVSVPKRPAAGDVIGSMMDLESMMVSWSINGEHIMWVTMPVQGGGEEVFPYVSASMEPYGVEIRLGNTEFRPPDYRDYSSPPDSELWARRSTAEPQSLDFYEQLSVYLEAASVTDLHLESSLQSALATTAVRQELPKYPLVYDFLRRQCATAEAAEVASPASPTDRVTSSSLECLTPYIRHLRAISDLTIMVARHAELIHSSTYLKQCYAKAKKLLFSTARWAIFETQAGGRPIFTVARAEPIPIDLQKARSALEDLSSGSSRLATRLTDSVTGQLFSRLENKPIYKNAVMFTVQLMGDVATDGGGVTRSILSMVADELNYHVHSGVRSNPSLPLFVLCGHSTMFTVVPNMALLSPSTVSDEDGEDDEELVSRGRRMLTWLGMVIGNITLCGTTKITLNFPRLVWKFLTFDPVTMADYFYDVDDTIRGSIDDDEFLLDDEFFLSIPGVGSSIAALSARRDDGDAAVSSVPATLGEVAEGHYGFSNISSSSTNRLLRPYSCMTPAQSVADLTHAATSVLGDLEDDFTTTTQVSEARRRRVIAEHALLHQYDGALAAIRNGLTTVISSTSLKSIRWDDLQTRVCGSPCLTATHVLSFLDCSALPKNICAMLQQVLERMTDLQRSQFLLFCSGQNRLPLPEKVHVTCGDEPGQLPTAHTCTPISLRLQPYDSANTMMKKLSMCLSHATQFGFV